MQEIDLTQYQAGLVQTAKPVKLESRAMMLSCEADGQGEVRARPVVQAGNRPAKGDRSCSSVNTGVKESGEWRRSRKSGANESEI